MSASQLGIYNGALRACGERKLASLTENREPRRLCDDVWADGFIDYCLSQGMWKFAIRTIKLDYSPDTSPTFGHRYAFNVPADFLRTVGLASDEYFTNPLLNYNEEQQFWFADLQTIYIRYVSNDPSYGGNLASWTPLFTEWAQEHMAEEIAPKLTSAMNRVDALKKSARRLLIDARSKDAMEDPTSFAPKGSWVRARSGGRGGRFDRGNTGSLLG